jgi:CheY-like chemotaxis protein
MTRDELKTPSKILIADDNQQNCELLEAYLSDGNYEIRMARDGQETLEEVARFQPDIVLLDIMMPRLSGYEVCQQLKRADQTRDIPILMVTALSEPGDIEKAVAAGCDDCLTKPVNRVELKMRVRSLLRVRHLTNERDRLLAYLAEVEGSQLPGSEDDDGSDGRGDRRVDDSELDSEDGERNATEQ